MKSLIMFLLFALSLSGCVSQEKYNELKLQKEKAISKTIKLEEKLKALQIYQQHLQDSLNNIL